MNRLELKNFLSRIRKPSKDFSHTKQLIERIMDGDYEAINQLLELELNRGRQMGRYELARELLRKI